jgi:hypothetical protein
MKSTAFHLFLLFDFKEMEKLLLLTPLTQPLPKSLTIIYISNGQLISQLSTLFPEFPKENYHEH